MATQQIVTFTGDGQTGDWSDPANWSGDHLPGMNIGLINQNAVQTGTVALTRLMLLGNEQVTLNGTVTTTSTNVCTSFMVCQDGTVTLTPGAALHSAGGLLVGVNGDGAVVANGSGNTYSTITSVAARVGQHAAGNGSVTINDAVWHNTGSTMVIGDWGQGHLTVENGGSVSAGGSFDVGLEAGSSGTVTLGGVGSALSVTGNAQVNNGTLGINAGAVMTVGGHMVVTGAGSVTLAGGTLDAHQVGIMAGGMLSGFGTVSTTGAFGNEGTVDATGGKLAIDGTFGGHGAFDLGTDGTLDLTHATIGLPTISFLGSNDTLVLAHGQATHGSIAGFAAGDTIAMAGIDNVSYTAGNSNLMLKSGGTTVDTLHLAGSYAGDTFSVGQSNGMGIITLAHP